MKFYYTKESKEEWEVDKNENAVKKNRNCIAGQSRRQTVVMTSSYDSELNSPLFYRNMDRPTELEAVMAQTGLLNCWLWRYTDTKTQELVTVVLNCIVIRVLTL